MNLTQYFSLGRACHILDRKCMRGLYHFTRSLFHEEVLPSNSICRCGEKETRIAFKNIQPTCRVNLVLDNYNRLRYYSTLFHKLNPDSRSLAKEVIDATRHVDVMADSLPVQDVEKLISALLSLGLSKESVLSLLSGNIWLLREVEGVVSAATTLRSNGLSQEVVVRAFQSLPVAFMNRSGSLLQSLWETFDQSLEHLRSMGFSEKDLQLLLLKAPVVLVTTAETRDLVLRNLKGLFTTVDARLMVKKCPGILADPWPETREKFDYAHFNMGYHQEHIVISNLFSHDFHHIQDRHLFLVRAGLFLPVKKKMDHRLNPNPPLKHVVDSTDSKFVRHFLHDAGSEQYQTFVSMRELEREEDAELDESGSESDDSSDYVDRQLYYVSEKKPVNKRKKGKKRKR